MSFIAQSTNASLSEALRWHLDPFATVRPQSGSEHIYIYPQEADEHLDPPPLSYFFGGFRFKDPAPEAVLRYLVWNVYSEVIAKVKDLLLLHAGAVAKDGGALLLPAAQDVGKSSLTAALLRAGFDYLSDELGAIDPITFKAYPFEKHIALDPEALTFFPDLADRLKDREGLNSTLTQRYIRPEDLDAAVANPQPIHHLVFPTENRNGSPRLKELTSAQAVERMSAHSFNLHVYADRGVIALARVARQAQAFSLDGGGPTERAALLAERLF